MAVGIDRAILLETDGREFDPVATAAAIVEAVRAQEAAHGPFDLLLFGNEAADTGGFQVGIRVAVALGRPIVIGDQVADRPRRDGRGATRGDGRRLGDLRGPAARRSSPSRRDSTCRATRPCPGRLRAKRKEIERSDAGLVADRSGQARAAGAGGGGAPVEILGRGPEAAPAVVDLLERIGVLAT